MVENNEVLQTVKKYFPWLHPALAEADARGIRLMVHVHMEGKTVTLPEDVLHEMLGLLLDEAVENLVNVREPVLYLLMHEEAELGIEVAYTKEDTRRCVGFRKNPSAVLRRKMAFFRWRCRYHLEHTILTIQFRGRDCICNRIRIPYE